MRKRTFAPAISRANCYPLELLKLYCIVEEILRDGYTRKRTQRVIKKKKKRVRELLSIFKRSHCNQILFLIIYYYYFSDDISSYLMPENRHYTTDWKKLLLLLLLCNSSWIVIFFCFRV